MANGAESVDCVGNGNLPFASHRVPQRFTQRAPSLPFALAGDARFLLLAGLVAMGGFNVLTLQID